MFKKVDKPEIKTGIKFWQNPNNKFQILMLHYSADPNKNPNKNGKKWYDAEKEGTPKIVWNKEYEIDFATKSGKLIYGSEFCDFSPDIHLINSFELDKVELIMSLDFGQRNPNCALIGALTRDNVIYIIDEYYNPAIPSVASREMFEKFEYLMGDLTNKTLAQKKDIADETFQMKVIDPSTCSKNRTKVKEGEEIPYSVIEDFEDNGWEFTPAQNDVDAGITRIREYFQLINGKAHLYIFRDKCPRLVEELINYRYQENSDTVDKTKNVSEKPIKKNDHGCDSLRYLIMTRPNKPENISKPKTRIQKDIESLIKPQIISNDWDIN